MIGVGGVILAVLVTQTRVTTPPLLWVRANGRPLRRLRESDALGGISKVGFSPDSKFRSAPATVAPIGTLRRADLSTFSAATSSATAPMAPQSPKHSTMPLSAPTA